MLGQCDVVTFVPTTDYAKARAFYEGTLGLRVISQDNFALVLDANGIMVRVTKVPNHTPEQHTILGWHVPDIAKTVRHLQDKVQFQQYGLKGQGDSGVWTAPGGDKVAWFKDPDGNVLSLTEFESARRPSPRS